MALSVRLSIKQKWNAFAYRNYSPYHDRFFVGRRGLDKYGKVLNGYLEVDNDSEILIFVNRRLNFVF